MKYSCEIIIDAPRDKVVALFDDPDNLSKWQPGFVSMKIISGNLGEVGSKSELKYKMGKRDIEMVETITAYNLPEVFSATYEAKNVWNLVENRFSELEDGKTLYTTNNEFKMKGMMKLMAWMMPGAFKKQSAKYLTYFKEFAEKELAC